MRIFEEAHVEHQLGRARQTVWVGEGCDKNAQYVGVGRHMPDQPAVWFGGRQRGTIDQ
jgi:hypothetical protein